MPGHTSRLPLKTSCFLASSGSLLWPDGAALCRCDTVQTQIDNVLPNLSLTFPTPIEINSAA